ncbi:MAG: DUF4912 domain-containing protein [Cyanobacteria bacterium J06648_10]
MSNSNIPLEEMTLRQLRRVASEYEVSRYSRMRKVELVAAIMQKQIAAGDRPQSPEQFTPTHTSGGQTAVEAARFATSAQSMGTAPTSTAVDPAPSRAALATVDEGLADLPGGYGESRIVLLPRDPQWAYAYWDIPNEHKQELRNQGGRRLALRFYDVTDININTQSPHSLQQYECGEMAREWYLPIPVSDRDYTVEVGYICDDGRWLVLSRSAAMRIPPVYPSDWVEDQFVTVDWNQNLRGRTVAKLVSPSQKASAANATGDNAENPIYDEIFAQAQSTEAQRIAGSLFGSMHQVPEQAVSSFVFPSGAGLWALPTASGINMSGAGMFASAPPAKPPRKFWLVADAELIVYGATEPDATVTVDGKEIELKPDGTFRFHVSFQDGVLRYPIVAVAKDGEQMRSVHMDFERKTLSRNTNTKAEAVEEWFA